VEVLGLTPAEMVPFKLRISLQRGRTLDQRRRQHAKDAAKALDDPKADPPPAAYGEPVAVLLPCLDPDVAETKQLAPAALKQRFLPGLHPLQQLKSVEMSLDELAGSYPSFYEFYPTPEVMRKLMARMLQIKEAKADAQLWPGFRKVYNAQTALPSWGPAEHLFAFGTGAIDEMLDC